MESRDLFAAACFAIVVTMVLLKLRYGPGSRRRKAAFTPAPSPLIRKGRIIVSGLKMAQANAMLADFARLYDLDAATFAVADSGEAVRVSWTRPITTDTALFLVNYLAYPSDDRLPGRQVEVAGVIPVPAEIAPKGVAAGTLAKIFVPEDDTEHDLVHALTADGRAFRISFTRMAWEPVAAAHASGWVSRLAFATEN
ncbi:hypothetical protein [Porphyrobacter sp. YT40]|uniref:hypothetical protein n=1 Tax=Porphyrobacter sp. YT40 TaxID=2547601 RepID=UPI001142823D|nr:hypothetical protein [Porphyrobacter sp. YT40]QDH34069.1 hypothetical protein E2E27_06820 [Porphyrobacter sp. YT40]